MVKMQKVKDQSVYQLQRNPEKLEVNALLQVLHSDLQFKHVIIPIESIKSTFSLPGLH